MGVVACVACGDFEDDAVREPKCPRCGLPAVVWHIEEPGYPIPYSVVPTRPAVRCKGCGSIFISEDGKRKCPHCGRRRGN
jgi:Zn finger protein HypA/HybF involved in hydrogenase expression